MTSRCSVLGTLLIALSILIKAECVSYSHDELAWTKSRWSDYKLNFPWSIFREREPEVKNLLNGPLANLAGNTLQGPQNNLDELIQRDIERLKNEPGSFAVGALDETGSRSTAVIVSQCKVCSALATHLWKGLVAWVNKHRQVPTKPQIRKYGQEVCEYEVAVDVLKEWIILQAKVQDTSSALQISNEAFLEFYLFSKRQRQHATPSEIAAVRQACSDIISGKVYSQTVDLFEDSTDPASPSTAYPGKKGVDDDEDDPYEIDDDSSTTDDNNKAAAATSQKPSSGDDAQQQNDDDNNEDAATMVSIIQQLLTRYHESLSKRAVEEGKSAESDATLIEEPLPNRECYDKHPQCEYWARIGECSNNPKYMVGSDKEGWCRKSCKACSLPPVAPLKLSVEGVSIMGNTSTNLLEKLKTSACTSNVPCRLTGAPSEALKSAGSNFRRSAVAQSASYVAGPLSNGADKIQSEVTTRMLKESEVVFTRNFQHAIVPTTRKYPIPKSTISSASAQIEKLLYSHIRETCLYINNGWWNYEVCYRSSITQFHSDVKQQVVDWEIVLGKFDRADWTIRDTNSTALFKPGTVVPYVQHIYTKGNDCDLDPEVAVLEGVSVLKRSTILRYMCSPDVNGHVTVQEPKQCRRVLMLLSLGYVVDVYLPQICDLPAFEPGPAPTSMSADTDAKTKKKSAAAEIASSQELEKEEDGDSSQDQDEVDSHIATAPGDEHLEEDEYEENEIEDELVVMIDDYYFRDEL